MSKTKIEWTDEVWNPVTGCSKVSQGCKHCYAERVFPRPYPGRAFTDVQMHPERIAAPLHWRKPRRVFVNSMSDLFHDDVPDEFIDQVFAVMALASQHTFQVLTKRPERARDYLARHEMPLPNVWLGVSVEDQETADYRIPLLLRTPAAVRWISAEPLLGPVDLGNLPSVSGIGRHLDALSSACKEESDLPTTLDWVIAGGESGPNARPMHPDWVRSLRDECADVGVPFFFKQWGDRQIASAANGHFDSSMATNNAVWLHDDGLINGPSWFRADRRADTHPMAMIRVGKKQAGRLLDGREHLEYPNARD